MQLSRKQRIPVIAAATLGLVAATGTSATALGSPAAAGTSATQQLAALSQGAKVPVIVMLKNQHPDLSAKTAKAQRKKAADTDQAPLLTSAKATGAQNVKTFSIVNGFSAKMTSAEADHLRADPSVAAVVADTMVPVKALTPQDSAAIKAQAAQTAPAAAPADHVIPGTCPTDPSKPLLEPEALQSTHTAFTDPTQPQAQNIVDGKGVKVAWIADGMDIHNPDFIRADGTPVFSDYQDFSGTDPNGTQLGGEAFGDASSIAAQGRQVYDLSQHVDAAHPLPPGCNITVRGIAPGASLVGINVFGAAGLVFNSTIVEAVDYAVNVDNVDVINESFGNNGFPTDGIDITSLADDAAVAAGVTVVASTGDSGPTNTIGQPATDPNVISVGATTNLRLQAQTGYAGTRNFATSWANDNSAAFSSGGISDRARVNDLVAPGQDGWAVCTPDLTRYSECTDLTGHASALEDFGGTSESSPFVAGGAALVIEAYKNTHNGVRPTPALVKQILTSTATDLGLPATEQGAGELNTYRAVRMAMSINDWNGSPTPQGDGLMITAGNGDTQLTVVGDGGSTHTVPVTVTNTSPDTQVVTPHGRILSNTLSDVTGSVNVAINDPASPFFLDGVGTAAGGPVKRRYTSTTFTVPPGADHLTGLYSFPGGGANGQSLLRLALIGPNGEYEIHSLPQGVADHGQVDLQHPAAGTWTAVFFASASGGGYHGAVAYEFVSTKYTTFGSVSPASASIAPGASKTFNVRSTLSPDAGDVTAAVEFDTALHGQSTIPLTLRTLLSTRTDGGAFSGTLTGGNGRGGGPAQAQSYYFDVPSGKRDLGIDLTLAGATAGHQLQVALETPDHQMLSLSTNQVLDPNGNPTLIPSLEGYADAPMAGRWILFVNDVNPVVGDTIGQQFTGHLRYDLVDVKANGLPHGWVAAGTQITTTVKVTNTGAAPEFFFADPRLTTIADYPLLVLPPTTATITLPFPTTSIPTTVEVPPHSTSVDFNESSTIPSDFDTSAFGNLPELYGVSHGLTASATVWSPNVTQGQWSIAPTAVGPTNAAVSGTATLGAVAHAQAFDPAAVTSTGDFWAGTVDASAPPLSNPLFLNPGQSGTITVWITPSAPSGTTVNGVVYVDDFAPFLGSGDELAGIPYSYTVK